MGKTIHVLIDEEKQTATMTVATLESMIADIAPSLLWDGVQPHRTLESMLTRKCSEFCAKQGDLKSSSENGQEPAKQ